MADKKPMNVPCLIEHVTSLLKSVDLVEIARIEILHAGRLSGYAKYINPLSFIQDDFARAGIQLQELPDKDFLARRLQSSLCEDCGHDVVLHGNGFCDVWRCQCDGLLIQEISGGVEE